MAKAVNWDSVPMLTPGMKNLGNQFNIRWPNRDGASDGAIGDYRHQQGTSGHNPDDTQFHNAEWDSDSDNKPEIRSIDVDSDLKESGTTMQMAIDHLRKLPNLKSVIRYMIYNRKIYHVNNQFKPAAYTGSSPHTEHAHFSGAQSQVSDENSRFDFKFEQVGSVEMTAFPRQGDSGEEIVYWQYVHNIVRNTVTPPAPTLTIDGDYGDATAAAFADFWKKVGGTTGYNGSFLSGWLATVYHKHFVIVNTPKSLAASPRADAEELKSLVNEWLQTNVPNSLRFVGALDGIVTLS